MSRLKVFLSYRRADTRHVAGRLGDRLSQRFELFMDIDDIPIGMDFTTVVRRAVNEADVLLVLIGPGFLAVDATGRRRLDAPGDWVAEEITAALARDITVIPVLVDGAPMPDEEQLPPALHSLRRRQALTVGHTTFNTDADRLINTLTDLEAARRPRAVPQEVRSEDLFADPDYSRAIAAAFNRRWAEAVDLFSAVEERFPADDRVRGPLADARQQVELERLDAAAGEAEQAGRWRDAVARLTELAELRTDDDHALARRLATARTELRMSDLTGQLRAMHAAEEWAGVAALSSQLAGLDPERADPDGLATAAAGRLTERRLGEEYAAGLRHLSDGRLENALAVFTKIARERPDYREVEDLVAMTRARLGPAVEPAPRTREVPAVEPSPPTPEPVVEAVRPLAAGPAPWLAVASLGVLLVLVQSAIDSYSSFGPHLVVALAVMVGLLVVAQTDARRCETPVGRLLRISSLLALPVGILAGAVSLPLVDVLESNGFDYLVFWFISIPLVAAIVGYGALRRRLRSTAIWPALLVVATATAGLLIVAVSQT